MLSYFLTSLQPSVALWPESWRLRCHLLGGLPDGSAGKESACSAGDLGSVPGSGRSPGEGNGNPLQFSCLENFMDREPGSQRVGHGWETNFHFHFPCGKHVERKTGNILLLLLSASSGLRQMPVVIFYVFKGLLDGMFLFFPHLFTLLSFPPPPYFFSSLSPLCPEKELYILDICL